VKLIVPALVCAAVVAAGAGSANGAGNACPTSVAPNELVLEGGSGQMGQLGKVFPQSLQVKLANTSGCALTGNIAGVTVEFDAPGSGPGGVFDGAHFAVVGTDSSGIATAPPFTANYTVGNYTVEAHSGYGSVGIGLSNTADGLPAAIAPQGSSSQEAAVNTQYAQPLQAEVTDATGAPVQGATVSFSVVTGPTGAGASFLGGAQATAVTNSDGIATSSPLLANGVPGKFTATASADGLSAVALFSLDNHAAAMTVSKVAAYDPTATVDTRYHEPLQARVLDATGEPVEGATVTFALAAADNGAGASFLGGGTQATALTDTDGLAVSPALIADKTAGAFTATASTAGSEPLAFTLTNLAARPYAVTAGAASGTSATVGARFDVPLAVTVTDEDGNPVARATVVFAAPKKGASGRFPHKRRTVRVKTNAKGIAVAPVFRANSSAGGYAVTVTVKGASPRTAFALVNRPRG